MQEKNIQELKIESMAYGGKGIAKLDGKVVFVDDVVTGDLAKIEITGKNKNFMTGKLLEIIEPSQFRVKPFCHLANACGGCQFQFIDYEYQLKIKKEMVEDCLKKIGGINCKIQKIYSSPMQKEFRAKIQLPLAQTKKSKRVLSGYYRKNSHELVNIKYCPIQPNIINEITETFKKLAQELDFRVYDEKTKKGYLRHLVFRYSQKENNLTLTVVVNSNSVDDKLIILADELKDRFKEITGICVNFNTTKSNLILTENYKIISGKDYIIEELLDKKYKISVGSFFQVNPKSAEIILSVVKDKIKTSDRKNKILDVYCGAGTFAINLSDFAEKIIAIETSESSINDFKENIKLNNSNNIELICDDAKSALADINEKFDFAIIDPPRKGCDKEVLEKLSEIAENIIYVSCNPSTLARDAKFLLENNYKLNFANCVDMFPNTYHIETVCVFERE